MRHFGYEALHSLGKLVCFVWELMGECGEKVKKRDAKSKSAECGEINDLLIQLRFSRDRKYRHFLIEQAKRFDMIARQNLQQRVQSFEHIFFGEIGQRRILQRQRILRDRIEDRRGRFDPLQRAEERKLAGERIAERKKRACVRVGNWM